MHTQGQQHKAKQQSHTFASRTRQRTDQSLQKSVPALLSKNFKIFFPLLLKKLKHPTAQSDTTQTMTVKRNIDNGLHGRQTEGLLLTSGFLLCWQTNISSSVCYYQLQSGLDIKYSALVFNFIISNFSGLLYRAGRNTEYQHSRKP